VRQKASRLRKLFGRVSRGQKPNRFQGLLSRVLKGAQRQGALINSALIAVAIELRLEARNKEAMFEGRATVVAKASRICLQKGQTV
jgi:hypothetical protein